MEIEIIEKRENPLLNRVEVKFRVKHEGEKTPERDLVKSDLADMLKTDKNLVIIDRIRPSFGVAMSFGYAKIYNSLEDVKKVEPEYILKRNKFGEKVEEKKTVKEEGKVEGEKEGKPKEESEGVIGGREGGKE